MYLMREIRSAPPDRETGDAAGLLPDVDQRTASDPWHTESAAAAAARLRTPDLTRKEFQVLELLARGYSNDGMAKRLFISESTVRTHLRSINYKLRVASRTQAVAIAHEFGLVA